jgi:predicted ABC-type ATPase
LKRRGRKSAAQTPAPKKEQVYGSSKNPVGSAASKTSASKIQLSDSIVKTLEDKRNDFNDNHPTKKVSLATLKAVMRRGMGAYSTSHRPTITGGAPNSRQAWGFARVNKFLKKYAGQKVKAAYVQDDDLMAKGGSIYHLGGDMSKHLAPNGKPSNLTDEQWHLVRTPEFKAWFGDWENDPQNASKVVDENGEPLVVFHGGGDFNYFDAIQIGKTDKGWYGYGFYFSPSQEISDLYGNSKPYFINIKKIFNCNKENPFYGATKEVTEYYINKGYEGSSKTFDVNKKYHEYCVFFKFPKSIKLADGSNTTFDAENPDIRYANGGLITHDNIEVKNIQPYKTTSKSGKFYSIFAERYINNEAIEYWIISFSRKDGINNFGYASYTYRDDSKDIYDEKRISLQEVPESVIEIYYNPDIRYEEGGELGQEITCVRCGWHWNTSDSEEYDKYVCHNCGFDNRTFYDSDPIGKYHTKDKNMYKKGGFNKISLPDTESSYDNLQSILAKQGYQLKRIMKPTKSVEEIAEEFDTTTKFIQDQLEIGTEHEMEHTYSREVAHDTALHHLAEDPEYYIYLKDMEMRREAQKLDGYYRSGGALSGETTCEVLDKDGERQIDPESIENMTECLNDLPQTKSFHFDYETNDYKPYRKRLHRDIIYEFKKDLVCVERQQPIAILMGGSPASGKSTFLKKYAPYLLKEEIFKVDADEIRSKLPEYRGYNATQTHLETKDIVNTLLSDRNIGIPCRFDVIYDGTMNNTKSYLPLINILKREGYKVFIVYIDRVQKDVIVKRALERYKKSGRFVPLEVIDDFFTKGKEALEQLKQEVDGYMIVDGSNQDYKIIERGGDTLPKNRNYSKIGEPIKITTEDVVREFKNGGEIDPDDPKIKSAMTHKAGASGGLLVGNRHSEGGIKAVNKSTGQPLEMEGGEVVINLWRVCGTP